MLILNDDVIHLILSSDTLRAPMWIQLDNKRRKYWMKYRHRHMVVESNIFYSIRLGFRIFADVDDRERFLIHYYADYFGRKVSVYKCKNWYHYKTCQCRGTNIVWDAERSHILHECKALQEELRVY